MKDILFYRAGDSRALLYAESELKSCGISFSSDLSDHVHYVLFNIPTKSSEINIPKHAIVIGGNLQGQYPDNPHIDLLQDERYLALNAALTAHGAIKIAMEQLPCTLEGCSVLIIGWGRIGKCLTKLLAALGSRVTIAARREASRSEVEALGFRAIGISGIDRENWRLIFNTVPSPVVSKEQAEHFSEKCVIIDLASKQGIECDRVIWARGIPGKEVPESSGALIAQTILHHLNDKEEPA